MTRAHTITNHTCGYFCQDRQHAVEAIAMPDITAEAILAGYEDYLRAHGWHAVAVREAPEADLEAWKKITETKTQVYEFTETTIRLPLFSPPLPKDILCQLAIPGEPGTKGRPRFNGHVYTPQETKDAEEYFAWIVRCSYPQLIPNRSHALGVCVAFFTKTRHRKDLDNLVKLIFDACNGVIWADDMQIIQLSSTVIRGDSMPRTELHIFTVLLVKSVSIKITKDFCKLISSVLLAAELLASPERKFVGIVLKLFVV